MLPVGGGASKVIIDSKKESKLLGLIIGSKLFHPYLDPVHILSSLQAINTRLKEVIPKKIYDEIREKCPNIYEIKRYIRFSNIINGSNKTIGEKLLKKMDEDNNLVQFAKILKWQIPNIPLNNAEKIRAFLKNPANLAKLNTITELDLSTSNLIFNTKPNFQIIPPEILYFPNLTHLSFSQSKISDLSPLAGLVKLKSLDLLSTNISDLSPLAVLENLTNLNLSRTSVSDLSPLAVLENLTNLDLSRTSVSDLTALGGLENLTNLDLSQNEISDLKPLAGLVKVKKLNLSKNKISNLSPLARLENLTNLDLSQNEIPDLKPLAGLASLEKLDLARNKISNLNPLAGLVKLTKLNLSKNEISDLTPLAGLLALNSIFLIENEISDLNPLGGLTNLEELYLSKNKISDLNPLKNLINLSELYLNDNKICDLTPILDLELRRLVIANNYLAPVSKELKERLKKIMHVDTESLIDQKYPGSEISTEGVGGGGGGSKKPRI
jgi:Leucine-rich repeat (LRR) protein